ncbi:protein FAM111A-like [Nannospalax galili]|uniref:protein FAM111A-like n=1 Tax=Nannospalax galili TaxID=1026970 RepID=UPI0004ED05E3|nr:protein FAM111A-like [Nannospalax galili]XP_017653396.1 protein FAM111A-like [Nannospalax galili]XP_029419007.1 protein FAM111A-like [Nannospalax galili]XP_029419008.1 protein FAM111A-like [Nannospalax galili]
MESQKRPRDVTNTQEQRFCSHKKTRQDQTTVPRKTIIITLGVHQKTYVLTHRETDSLYAGLKTLNAVKEEIKSHQGKKMLVCGTEGIEGYIHLGTPLSCFPESSRVVITFSKTESEQEEDNLVFGWQDQSSDDCVIFYINAFGKRKKRIVRCKELDKEEYKLCVYGFKGETIKDTLRKDGRFLSFVENDPWKLLTDQGYIIENTQPIDKLEGKLFQVEVEIRKSPGAARASRNSKLEEINLHVLKEDIMEKYCKGLKEECEKVRRNIKEETKKLRKSLFKAHRRAFKELTKNSTPGKRVKFLSQSLESVGYISWNSNGKTGGATCFVFRGLYIFTCWHVLNDIVGIGREPREHTDVISQSVKVTFDYEDYEELDIFFLVEPWLEVGDGTLDYAVLKLKENGQQVPPGLYNETVPRLPSDLMYMISHPDGKPRIIDACTVVFQSIQKRENQECVQGGEAMDRSDPEQYIRLYTQRSFQKTTRNPDGITSNAFYCGSSGSPVFDCEGSLVAMHTVGFSCEDQHGVSSIIELGLRMERILNDIKQKHEIWYNEVCAQQQDVEMHSLE